MEENQSSSDRDQNELPTLPSQPDTQYSTVQSSNGFLGQVAVSGQPPAPQPVPANQQHQAPVQKRSKWHAFFMIINIVLAATVALFFLLFLAIGGKPGSEFIGIFFEITIVPIIGVAALINLIGLPIYFSKKRPRGKSRLFLFIAFLISIVLFFFIAIGAYGFVTAFRSEKMIATQQEKLVEEENKQYDKEFAAENPRPERSKEEAIQLIQSCVVEKLFYAYQNNNNRQSGEWGELSSTGAVVTVIDGKPSMMSIADRLVPELLPIAQEAQKTCNGNPDIVKEVDYDNL